MWLLYINVFTFFSVPQLDELTRSQPLCQLFVYWFTRWSHPIPNLWIHSTRHCQLEQGYKVTSKNISCKWVALVTISILTSFRKFSKISAKKNLEILENCNYAVELGKKLNFVLVGIQGDDIKTGNKMLTLALVWQLMRKYTLSLLAKLSPDGSPIVESEIIHWANQRLQDSNKETSIKHFQVWTFIFF